MTWLASIRLSLAQWGLLSLAVALGIAVVAFRLQGSQLHKAQLALLLATMRQADSGREKAVEAARDRFNVAYKEYLASQPGEGDK